MAVLRSPDDYGNYIILNGVRHELTHHSTDFVVLDPDLSNPEVTREAPSRKLVRLTGADPDEAMAKERRNGKVAYHVYEIGGSPDRAEREARAASKRRSSRAEPDADPYQPLGATENEPLQFDDRIIVTLRDRDPDLLTKIADEFRLLPEPPLGESHVFRVTAATGMNPLKAANRIAEIEGVAAAVPHLLLKLQRTQSSLVQTNPLFRKQWYLNASLLEHPSLRPDADIDLPEAWEITSGSPEVVVAILDDGFDLGHPAFRNTRIHPGLKDFGVLPTDTDPASEAGDFHGTPVASIAVGSLESRAMAGVAPGCTLLPIRLGFGESAPQIDMLEVFRYISARADVVNCSFGTSPSSLDQMHPDFRREITSLTETGGRRNRGLAIVFAAGNDDAPTLLSAAANVNGVFFRRGPGVARISPGRPVFSFYPSIPGVTVVAAMSSMKRKSGYSNWGPHITVAAPSNNTHELRSLNNGDPATNPFAASYPGLGQIAASNRPQKGDPTQPMPDDPQTTIPENFYTERFGGTSGASPVVTGVIALMISVNPHLTAAEINRILRATADQDLDTGLDNPRDPNIQGLSGDFVQGRSLFFGAGKVNARRAVIRARALLSPPPNPLETRALRGIAELPRRASTVRMSFAEEVCR